MSTEVECHRYLHRGIYDEDDSDDSEEIDWQAWVNESTDRRKGADTVHTDGEISDSTSISGDTEGPTVSPEELAIVQLPRRNVFRHNPLHDLESVLWVSIWVTVCSTFIKNNPKITDEEWGKYLERHSAFAAQLFGDPSFRRDAMSSSLDFLDGFNGLIPELSWVALRLDDIKSKLLARYKAAEKRLNDPNYQIEFEAVAGKLHFKMVQVFGAISGALHKKDLKIDVQMQTQKRKQIQETLITAHSSPRLSSEDPPDNDDRPRKAQKTHPGQIASSASAVSLDRSSRGVGAQNRTVKKRHLH